MIVPLVNLVCRVAAVEWPRIIPREWREPPCPHGVAGEASCHICTPRDPTPAMRWDTVATIFPHGAPRKM